MSSSRFNSLTVFVAVAGMAFSQAWAGDKIEFSDPGASLGVPKVERPDDPVAQPELPTAPGGNMVYPAISGSSDVIVISRKRKDADSSDSPDSPYGDDQDKKNPYAAYDKATSRLSSPNGSWNYGDSDKERKQNGSSLFSYRKDDASGAEGLRGRMEGDSGNNRSSDPWQARYGSRSDSRDGSFFNRSLMTEEAAGQKSSWSRDMFHPGQTALDRITDKNSTASYWAGVKAINDARGNITPAGNMQDTLQRDAATASATSYSAPWDDTRRNGPNGALNNAPRFTRPAEPSLSAPVSEAYSTSSEAATLPGYAPARPAVLAFPKRPGDLLR